LSSVLHCFYPKLLLIVCCTVFSIHICLFTRGAISLGIESAPVSEDDKTKTYAVLMVATSRHECTKRCNAVLSFLDRRATEDFFTREKNIQRPWWIRAVWQQRSPTRRRRARRPTWPGRSRSASDIAGALASRPCTACSGDIRLAPRTDRPPRLCTTIPLPQHAYFIINIDQSGDDREISFLFQRLSVLIQRYDAVLLHDCFVKEEEEE